MAVVDWGDYVPEFDETNNEYVYVWPSSGIPTVSAWGLLIMALLLVAGGKIAYGRRRTVLAGLGVQRVQRGIEANVALSALTVSVKALVGRRAAVMACAARVGLTVAGDFSGMWYESCAYTMCDVSLYDNLQGSSTVTVNANELFELTHDESLTIEPKEPLDGDGAVEGKGSFVVDLELVDQSGTYELEYIPDEEYVPTVTTWGLAVIVLLLVGAKVYYGRLRSVRT